MDWTSAEEDSVFKETHGDAKAATDSDHEPEGNDEDVTIIDYAQNDEAAIHEEDEARTTDAPQIVYSSQPYQTSTVTTPTTKSQTLSQYVVTYVPTTPTSTRAQRNSQEEQTLVHHDSTAAAEACNRPSYVKTIDDAASPTAHASTTVQSYQVVSSIDSLHPHRNSIASIAIPAKDSSSSNSIAITTSNNDLNYFLMDVAQVMNKLSDIAQMEIKIEINKLLLGKLKDSKNLQRTSEW